MASDAAALVGYSLIPVTDPQGFYRDGRWAEPNLDQAAALLATLIDDAGARAALGERARAHAAEALDPVRLGRQARSWLGHAAPAADRGD